MTDQTILNAISQMFLAFPAARNTSAAQVKLYAEAVKQFPASVVSRVMMKFATGQIDREASDYPPSLGKVIAAINAEPMNALEQREWFRLHGKPEPIAYSPPAQADEPKMTEEQRKAHLDALKAKNSRTFSGRAKRTTVKH